MRFRHWFTTLLLLLLPCAVSFAEENYRELFAKGQYNEALQALETSADGQQKNATYYFNRGVIYHALNQSGFAVAYLEKARSMNVQDEDVEDALDDARAALGKFIGASKLDPSSHAWETWGEELPLEWISLGLAVLTLIGMILFFTTNRMPLIGLGVLILSCFGIFGWDLWTSQHPAAMVLESRIAKSGPGNEFLDRGTVETGMKLRLTSAEPVQGWYRVRLNTNGDQGFLPESTLLLLGVGSTKSE